MPTRSTRRSGSIWGRLDKLGAKVSGVPQMPPKTDYRAQRENLSRIKRVGDFRNAIIKLRHGLCLCDACNVALKAVIEGAHVHQVFENGDFHPSNGLLFCANHHRMWDRDLSFAIDPENGAIVQAHHPRSACQSAYDQVPLPGVRCCQHAISRDLAQRAQASTSPYQRRNSRAGSGLAWSHRSEMVRAGGRHEATTGSSTPDESGLDASNQFDPIWGTARIGCPASCCWCAATAGWATTCAGSPPRADQSAARSDQRALQPRRGSRWGCPR